MIHESLSFLFDHIDWNERPQEQQLYGLLRQGLVDAAAKLGDVAGTLGPPGGTSVKCEQ